MARPHLANEMKEGYIYIYIFHVNSLEISHKIQDDPRILGIEGQRSPTFLHAEVRFMEDEAFCALA